MAIFHLTTKPISRSSGRSSTASAAYRAACKIEDIRTGLTHDYSKKSGVFFSECLILDKYNELIEVDRNELWNTAEKTEKRKDARTAREIIINLPHEVSDDLRKTMVYEFATYLATELNVAVDYAIHRPDSDGDNRNHHCHIMLTTRTASLDKDKITLGDKTRLELSNTKLDKLKLPKTQDQIKDIRKRWADTANTFLKIANVDASIDHRSFAERGIDKKPSIKMGWRSMQAERAGHKTKKGDVNRLVKSDNEQLEKLSIELAALKHELHEEIRQEITPIIVWNTNSDYVLNGEKLNEYNEDKLDYRQTDLLKDFKKEKGLDKNDEIEGWKEYRERIDRYMKEPDNFNDDKHIVDMLRNPKAEREQYENLIKSDVELVVAIDKTATIEPAISRLRPRF